MILHGENVGAVAAAFVRARAAMQATIAKDATAKAGSYSYSYLTLGTLMEAIAPHLHQNNLALVQEASLDTDGVTIETWIIHESGGMLQFAPLTMPLGKRDAQAVGSAISYGRRYAITAICGIAADDDDGQAATDAVRGQKQAQSGRRTQQAPKTPTQHRNGAHSPAALPDVTADEVFGEMGKRGDVSEATIQRLQELGVEMYGGEWHTKQAQLIEHASGGEAKTVDDLYEAEAQVLIKGIEKRMKQAVSA